MIPVLPIIEHIVYQLGILYTNGDHPCITGRYILKLIGVYIAAGSDRPRTPDNVKCQAGIIVGRGDPCRIDPGCHGTVHVCIHVVVEVLGIPRICHFINVVHIVDEIKNFGYFRACKILFVTACNGGSVAHGQVIYEEIPTGTKTIYIDHTVTICISGESQHILSPLFPGPLASLIEFVRILQTYLVQHLLVECKRIGIRQNHLCMIALEQIYSVAGSDINLIEYYLVMEQIIILGKYCL